MFRPILTRFSPALILAVAISISVAIVILTAILWFIATIYKADRVAFDREREKIEKSFRQIGASSARELRIQTVWTEGFSNAISHNTEWMEVYYGPYLNRLLDYDSVLVLSDKDQVIYSYSVSLPATQVSRSVPNISDLITAVRGDGLRATVPVEETIFRVGEGKTVQHRAASDMRLIAGVRMMVVVSTIVPDTAVTVAPTRPYIMIAMLSIDQHLLNRIAGDCGVTDLHWNPVTTSTGAKPAIRGYDGSSVGELRWTGQRPGHEILSRMRYGLSSGLLLMIGSWFYFSRRAIAHARMIDSSSDALAQANKSLERQAADRSLELEATLNCIAQGLVLLRSDGSIALRNTQVMTLLGVTSDDALASAVKQLLADFAFYERTDGKRPRDTLRRDITLSSGRVIELRIAGLPDERQVVTITDISVSKKRQHDLEKAIVEAQAASQAKTRFLSTMSHEMRTPLNGIIGTLELIGGTTLTQEQTELVDIAIESSEALLVHINDVLDFSKMEAGKLELILKPFLIRDLLHSVASVIRPQADAAGNQLVLTLPPDLPSVIVGDRVRLRQVLLNLVSNANKFTRNGRITLDARLSGGSDDMYKIEISVSDTGVGIPKDRLSDLFQEFSMLDSSLTRRSSGTGLGLAISKRLIEAMGGEIGVDSVEGKGSRFWFRVAFHTSDHVSETSAQPLALHHLPKSLNILLVDDNATNRLVGTRLLEAEGHTVTSANNGKKAVELARVYPTYDVILMDISMPEMDGIQATRCIRCLPKPFSTVKIVALTANAIVGDRERFLEAGMDDYLTKPLRRATLIAALNSSNGKPSKDEPEPGSHYVEELVSASEVGLLAAETGLETTKMIMESYIVEVKERQQALVAASLAQDFGEIKRCAHAIAGASASVGALRARRIASDIEFACINGKEQNALALSSVIHDTLQETIEALSKMGAAMFFVRPEEATIK